MNGIQNIKMKKNKQKVYDEDLKKEFDLLINKALTKYLKNSWNNFLRDPKNEDREFIDYLIENLENYKKNIILKNEK